MGDSNWIEQRKEPLNIFRFHSNEGLVIIDNPFYEIVGEIRRAERLLHIKVLELSIYNLKDTEIYYKLARA